MAFMPPFGRTFQAPFAGPAVALPWWNIDGLTPGGAGGTCIAAYQPKAGGLYWPATIAESYVNRANPGTYDAAPGVAPTWAAGTGWTFNGTTQYLTTGIAPASGYAMIVRISNGHAVSGDRATCGSYDVPNSRFTLGSNYSTLGRIYGSGGYVAVSPGITNGNLCVAGQQGYLNGVADGGAIGAWTAVNPNAIYIGGVNAIGVAGLFWSGDVVAWAVYSGLTAAQVLARATVMALI